MFFGCSGVALQTGSLRHLHREPEGFGPEPEEENSLCLGVLGRKMVQAAAP